MIHQRLFFAVLFAAIALFITIHACAQDLESLKPGVVRIVNDKRAETGTGFVTTISGDTAFIVTASHLVSGTEYVNVYLYGQQNTPLTATVRNREIDQLKGLALLTLKASPSVINGLVTLQSGTSDVKGGAPVQIIGFPDGTIFWTIVAGNVARIEGRNILFSAPISVGNSGGPVFLNGRVIGLVTDIERPFNSAVQIESVLLYLRGVMPAAQPPRSTDTVEDSSGNRSSVAKPFCSAVSDVIIAGRSGFGTITGAETNIPGEYHTNFTFPGASAGAIKPNQQVRFIFMQDTSSKKIEDELNRIIVQLKNCMPTWEQKVDRSRVDYGYHLFRNDNQQVVVSVAYESTISGRLRTYTLSLKFDLVK